MSEREDHRDAGRRPAASVAGYHETAPPVALATHVRCLWSVRPDASGLGPAAGEVLPDGCTDLVWHGGRLIVAGPDTTARSAGPGDGTAIGVRLRPGAATVVGASASSLRDQHPDAEALWGASGRRLADRLASARGTPARAALLLEAIGARIVSAPAVDPAVACAVDHLTRAQSTVAGAATSAGVSERLLHRRFTEHVGYGPKTLQRVLRLQRFLNLVITTDEDLAGLAVLSGYADQAHLARETRDLAATTPGRLVERRRSGRTTALRVSDSSKTRSRRRGTMDR